MDGHRDKKLFSIRAQLTIMITVVCFGVLLGLSLVIYKMIFDIFNEKSQQETLQQFKQIEYNVNTFKGETKKAYNILLSDARFQKFVAKETDNLVESIYLDIDLVDSVSDLFSYYEFIDSIAVFTERGEIYNFNRSQTKHILNSEHPFYSTLIYQDSLEDLNEYAWVVGSNELDTTKNNTAVSENIGYVTCYKGIKTYYSEKKAVVAISIEESYFTDLYHMFDNKSSLQQVYIITRDGIVLPSETEISDNKRQEILMQIKDESTPPYSDFIFEYEDPQLRIIHYAMDHKDWILVKEISISELSEDIIILRRIVSATFFISFCIIMVILYFWTDNMIKPIHELSDAMKDLGGGKLGLTLKKAPKNEIGLLIMQFNKMSVNINNLIDENKQIEEEKRNQEIKALQAQINPHFMYNVLNSIKYMAIISNAKNVADSITVFGNLIKPLFRKKSIMYTLREELELLENYIEIFNIRYGNDISLTYDIDDKYLECIIPRFIMQPIVENSIIHGIHQTKCRGLIEIKGYKEKDYLTIAIKDNGSGMTSEQVKVLNEALTRGGCEDNSSIGIENVNRRIKLHFGTEFGIRIESIIDGGATVYLKIPVEYKNSNLTQNL